MNQSFPLTQFKQIQKNLLIIAAIFLFIGSISLTLSPAVRERSWNVEYPLTHWMGYITWILFITISHRSIQQHIPESDPFLLPIAALLTGWGILTISRLLESYGQRQTIWLAACLIVLLLGARLDPKLFFLQRYKYLLLTTGILLTALTIAFGTNPLGSGPRLWLGCCGIYFQPSEPLKLLLVIFLSAYFSEKIQTWRYHSPPIGPTLIVTGLALLLLIVQRDLGAASLFIFIYTIMLYLVSRRKQVLVVSFLGILVAGLIGYFLFDVVRLRVDAWINPWFDPINRSYQIVQSLLAIANGGIGGRGFGMGNPGLVPVAISDFIYSAIAEETGLIGSIGLLILLSIFLARGIRAALYAQDHFRRLLAAGLTTYIGSQSILIIAGNLRLLPLTGVTLPFVSYGGSSLLTSFIALILLLLISHQKDHDPEPLVDHKPYVFLGNLLFMGFIAVALTNGWWAFIRGPDLLTRTDNARRAIADRYVPRGNLYSRNNIPITITDGEIGDFKRNYLYPELVPVTGYNHPIYGQSGLEASLDTYLRGTQGNPVVSTWLDHLLYGQSPPGLDIRISVDLRLQNEADQYLFGHNGAVVMMNAKSGEILVMASSPTFDPNKLGELIDSLTTDPDAPFVNRAVQGQYPLGEIADVFLKSGSKNSQILESTIVQIYELLGFFEMPQIRLQVPQPASSLDEMRVSPIQATLAGAVLSNNGVRPAPRLVTAVNIPSQGWTLLPSLGKEIEVIPSYRVEEILEMITIKGRYYWLIDSLSTDIEQPVSWSIAGTTPNWQGPALVIAVLLEEENLLEAEMIALNLLESAISYD